ncbi:MAG: hypothetical protein PHW76_08650 [Alphaproteobacteria bacterium]|nr:hypothetical protein [Alphaproteobacteria bacterium]
MGVFFDNTTKTWPNEGGPSKYSDRLEELFQGFVLPQDISPTSVVLKEAELPPPSVKAQAEPEFGELFLDYWPVKGGRLKVIAATVVPDSLQNIGKTQLTWSEAYKETSELKNFGGYDGLKIAQKQLQEHPESAIGGWVPASDAILRRLKSNGVLDGALDGMDKKQAAILQNRRLPIRFELLKNSL